MFDKAKAFMEDHLKAFGVTHIPPIIETEGKGVFTEPDGDGIAIAVGRDTVIEKLPVVEWMVAAGRTLLLQSGSDAAVLHFGPESETNETVMRVADDLYYITDLAAIYQCYLKNPVEAYCIYDDAIELKDDTSLHPIAVALGLSHPRGLESMGFDKKQHEAVFEEADFFKSVITQKRPDLSLLVALQNAWQKQKGVEVKVRIDQGILRFTEA
jgi:hypothetical protein